MVFLNDSAIPASEVVERANDETHHDKGEAQ